MSKREEKKNLEMIDLLYSLDKQGPDSLLINTQGWTVFHFAAQAADLKVRVKRAGALG